jgi:hypothetical protein
MIRSTGNAEGRNHRLSKRPPKPPRHGGDLPADSRPGSTNPGDADWLAVGPVNGEPVSGARFLDPQGKYREFARFRGGRGVETARSPAAFRWISLGPGTGNDGPPIRELPAARVGRVSALAPRPGGASGTA